MGARVTVACSVCVLVPVTVLVTTVLTVLVAVLVGNVTVFWTVPANVVNCAGVTVEVDVMSIVDVAITVEVAGAVMITAVGLPKTVTVVVA